MVRSALMSNESKPMIARVKPRKPRKRGRPVTHSSVGRDALVAAAREALKRKPPGEITLHEIAQIAKVDPALIRYYFGQLPELFMEATTEVTRELRGKLAGLITLKGSVRERLNQRIRVYLGVFRENPNYNRLLIDVVHLSEHPNRDAVLRLFRHSLDEMRELVQEGVATGEIKDIDSRFLQLAIASMAEFFYSARPVFEAIFGEEAKQTNFVNQYAGMIVALIESSGEARNPRRQTRRKIAFE
jgi:AcrR family transcriptional regulator